MVNALKYKTNWLLILIFLFPAPFIIGNNVQTTYISIFLLSFLIIFFLNNKIIDKRIFSTLILFFVFLTSMAISFLTNIEHVASRDIGEFIRIFIYIQLMLLGYLLSPHISKNRIASLALLLMVVELVLSLSQFFHIGAINTLVTLFFYQQESGRINGSYFNPSMLSIFFLMFGLIYLLIKDNEINFRNKKVWLFIFAFVIISLLSGSRTAFLLFIGLLLFEVSKRNKFLSIFLFSLIILSFIVFNEEIMQLGYLGQLALAFSSGQVDLSQINSFAIRLWHWENKYDQFVSMGDMIWFFGASPRKDTAFAILDNELLHVLFRYGVFGVILYYAIFVKIFIDIRRYYKTNVYAKILFYWIVILFISGITIETFSSWTYMPPFMFFLGLLYGSERKTMSKQNIDFKNKVCVVAPVHNCNDVRVFHKVAKTLAEQNYYVILYARCEDAGWKDGVYIKSVPNLGKYLRMLYLPILFVQLILERAKVYHFNNPDTLPLAIVMKKMGYKVIYDTHEDFSQRIMTKEWIPFGLRTYVANIVTRLEKYLAVKADAFFVTQNELVEKYTGSTLLLNAPIVDNDFIERVVHQSDKIIKDRLMVVYAGHTISYERGIEQMIDAINIVNKEIDVGFWLIGNIDNSYLEKISKLEGFKYVEYLGYLDYEKAMSYVHKADIGLVTILDVADHKNTSANKIYEYMLFETPFIASNFEKWQNELKGLNAGVFVDPSKPREISNSILSMINDNNLSFMFINGKDYINDKFNWDIESQKLTKVYQGLVK